MGSIEYDAEIRHEGRTYSLRIPELTSSLAYRDHIRARLRAGIVAGN